MRVRTLYTLYLNPPSFRYISGFPPSYNECPLTKMAETNSSNNDAFNPVANPTASSESLNLLATPEPAAAATAAAEFEASREPALFLNDALGLNPLLRLEADQYVPRPLALILF